MGYMGHNMAPIQLCVHIRAMSLISSPTHAFKGHLFMSSSAKIFET